MVFAADGRNGGHKVLQPGKLLTHEGEKREKVPEEGVPQVYFGLPPGRLKLQFPCTVPLECGSFCNRASRQGSVWISLTMVLGSAALQHF